MSIVSDKLKCIFFDVPKTGSTSIQTLIKGMGQANKLHSHMSPKAVYESNWFPVSLWESYFKFSFIRNPLDRTYSIYSYYKMSKDITLRDPNLLPETFKEFVMDIDKWMPSISHHFSVSQVKWLDKEIDFIGRFDYMQEDIYKVFDILSIREDIPFKPILGHLNPSDREKHYQDVYSKEMSHKVLDYYFDDVIYMYQIMGYTKTHFDISVNLDFSE